MADALASGASVRKNVGVQVPPRPQIFLLNSAVIVGVNLVSPAVGNQLNFFRR